MATHSSVLAWRIPGMGEPGGLPSMGLHRVGHDWSDWAAAGVLESLLCHSLSTLHRPPGVLYLTCFYVCLPTRLSYLKAWRISPFFKKHFLNVYFCSFIHLRWALVMAWRTINLCCSMWDLFIAATGDLVPWPGIELGLPELWAWSVSHGPLGKSQFDFIF